MQNNKILVIDDNSEVRMLVSIILSSEKFIVSSVNNGQEAIEYLKNNELPNLIILDHNMEIMNGPEFLLAIEKELPLVFKKVPIVMMTAHGAHMIAKNKATEILTKNGSFDQIVNLAKKYCV